MDFVLRHPKTGLYYTEWDIAWYAELQDEPMTQGEAVEELIRDGFEVVRLEDLEMDDQKMLVELLDGINRIADNTHSANVRKVETPYYTKEEAAEYLRTTVAGIYGRVERRELERCTGVHGYLFTKEMLDDSAMGRVRKPMTKQTRKRRQGV